MSRNGVEMMELEEVNGDVFKWLSKENFEKGEESGCQGTDNHACCHDWAQDGKDSFTGIDDSRVKK